jgi:protease-4
MSRRAKRWLIFLIVLFVVLFFLSTRDRLSDGSVLVLSIGGPIEEHRPPGVAGSLAEPSMTVLHQVLQAMEMARGDERIAGLVLKISPVFSGWAKIQEIRAQVADFRKSGKPTICFLASDLVDNRQYYLATACEQTWLARTGTLGLTGLMAQATFLRGTFDKLGIQADFLQLEEYKTYPNQYTQRKFTRPHRESTESLVREIAAQYFADVAQARRLEPAEVERLAAAGPYLESEAIENKLVDRGAYWDEVQEFFRQRTGDWKPVELRRYLRELRPAALEKIAVVHATGDIIVGRSDFDSLGGSYFAGSESVSGHLRRAREDAGVKAIILRVDSGGGSALASELIRREVERARKAKPVVVSMSDLAASGGYWIAMPASRIVSDPATLTGSIGVVFGKLNIAGLYDLLGLSTDYVATSENATLLWPHQNFTPAQREMVQRMMRQTYDTFLDGVAESRKMKREEVLKVAKGRVWTGGRAKELGLVDELGGFARALALARELAGIPAGAPVEILRYPEEKTLFQELIERADVRAPLEHPLARLRRILEGAGPLQMRMPFRLSIR